MKKTIRIVGAALVAVLFCVGFTACSDDEPTVNYEHDMQLLGTWFYDVIDANAGTAVEYAYTFTENGNYELTTTDLISKESTSVNGTWTATGTTIVLAVPGQETNSEYYYKVSEGVLYFGTPDEDGNINYDIELTKVHTNDATIYGTWAGTAQEFAPADQEGADDVLIATTAYTFNFATDGKYEITMVKTDVLAGTSTTETANGTYVAYNGDIKFICAYYSEDSEAANTETTKEYAISERHLYIADIIYTKTGLKLTDALVLTRTTATQHDTNLVGKWEGTFYTANSVAVKYTYDFKNDGNYTLTAKIDNQGNEYEKVTNGTWMTNEGVLTTIWSADDANEFSSAAVEYIIKDGRLYLADSYGIFHQDQFYVKK